MDIERLKEFLLIYETGSFRSAAKVLDIAPSVLSTRFKNFESSIGTKLLVRNSKYIELTDSGKLLIHNAKDLIQNWETVKKSVKSLKGTEVSSLKLQLCAQTMPSELGPFLDLYNKNHPGLLLDLYDDDYCPVREGLLSGKTDIAFIPGEKDDFLDVSGRVVLAKYDHLMVHVPANHRLAGESEVFFRELAGESFIPYPVKKEAHIRNLQLSMLKRSGIPYHLYENDCSPLYFDLLVPIGKGIEFCNWDDRITPNTVNLTIRDSGYETFFFMLYHKENPNPIIADFMEQFLKYREMRL
ncbi:MAG: LysR family transcriptional regulator [Lachnospiraceae bacterium]|nr:LysR family transcriptional regulator [Lachnospiraceae bacterium]